MMRSLAERYFWLFAVIQGLWWTALPTIFRHALPHDTIEAVLWGQHFEWGYDKNPWLVAWLAHLGALVGGTSGVGIYFLSSAFITLSFWSVWQLAREFLPSMSALASVLVLEGTVNYTLVPQSFNDNLLELGLWPLMFYSFYRALQAQKTRDWIICSIAAGLAMMAKYYTAIPLLTMLIFLLATPQGRVSFFQRGFYWALGLFVLIILPHLIWLFEHQFITVTYAFDRTQDVHVGLWKRHFYYPLAFIQAQIADFVGAMVLLGILWRLCRTKNSNEEGIEIREIILPLSSFQKKFLWTMAIGPVLLTVIPATLLGWRLYYQEWGIPLISLWGIVLVSVIRPRLTLRLLKKFLMIVLVVMLLWGVGYAGGLYLDKKRAHSDNYPAQQIADYVTQQWWQRYHKPLKYIAGSRYVCGYISFYSPDHPSVYVEWHQPSSEWINMQAMRHYGVLFVQDNYYGTTLSGLHPNTDGGKQFPVSVLHRFPQLQVMPVHNFYWHRNGQHLAPIPLLLGFLPPEK